MKRQALERGPHQSANAHTAFLCEEFAVMIRKRQWIILPAKQVMTEDELWLSPLGVLPQRDRWPRSIIDLSFYCINDGTVNMAPPEAMQFKNIIEAHFIGKSAIESEIRPCLSVKS
jgi:hypothetical protein